MDFYSKFGDIAIPATKIILAGVVYAQQRWIYERISQILTVGKCGLLPLGSRMYKGCLQVPWHLKPSLFLVSMVINVLKGVGIGEVFHG